MEATGGAWRPAGALAGSVARGGGTRARCAPPSGLEVGALGTRVLPAARPPLGTRARGLGERPQVFRRQGWGMRRYRWGAFQIAVKARLFKMTQPPHLIDGKTDL